jgi:hypothetical protein
LVLSRYNIGLWALLFMDSFLIVQRTCRFAGALSSLARRKVAMGGDDCARQRRLRIETVRGEPYILGGRKLVPVARIVSFGRARATVGTDGVGGWGAAIARITPVAVEVESAAGKQRVAITDATATALRGMLAGALIMVAFFTAIRWLARSRSENGGANG